MKMEKKHCLVCNLEVGPEGTDGRLVCTNIGCPDCAHLRPMFPKAATCTSNRELESVNTPNTLQMQKVKSALPKRCMRRELIRILKIGDHQSLEFSSGCLCQKCQVCLEEILVYERRVMQLNTQLLESYRNTLFQQKEAEKTSGIVHFGICKSDLPMESVLTVRQQKSPVMDQHFIDGAEHLKFTETPPDLVTPDKSETRYSVMPADLNPQKCEESNGIDNVDESVKKGNCYQCHTCSASCSSKQYLRNHIKRHGSCEALYRCPVCSIRCSVRSQIQSHVHLHHPGVEIHLCGRCPEVFQKKLSLIDHMKAQHKVSCELCGQCVGDMNSHLKTHEANGTGKRKCPKCCFFFSGRQSYEEHFKLKHPDVVLGHECRLFGCFAMFETSMELDEHVQLDHAYCGVCSKVLPTHSALVEHSAAHTKDRPYTCVKCRGNFKSAGTLRKHITSVHSETRDCLCPQCGKCFKSKADIRSHVRNVHDKPANGFKCDKCPKTFKKAHDLLNHFEGQHMNNVYKCSSCPRNFKTKSRLSRHEIAIHQRESSRFGKVKVKLLSKT